jgi:hypothetical protein
MQCEVQNIILLLVYLSFGYALYRQNKKLRAEEKKYTNSSKLSAMSTPYDQQEEEETKQIA